MPNFVYECEKCGKFEEWYPSFFVGEELFLGRISEAYLNSLLLVTP